MSRLLIAARALLVAAIVSLVATAAHAQGGINLSWNDCGTFGNLQRNFAFNTNVGTNEMYGSAIAGVAMPQLGAHTAVIDLQTNQAGIPPWWNFGLATCRPNSALTASFNFTTNVNCLDPWAGQAGGGRSYTTGVVNVGAPNRARIKTTCGLVTPVSIDGTSEYYIFKVVFSNVGSAGLPPAQCQGCTDGVCFVFNSVTLFQAEDIGNRVLTLPITRNYIQWQGGAVGGGPYGGTGCPGATPSRVPTWGGIKTLYR